MTKKLISFGASLDCRCKWTDMAALHYASYFDVGPVLTALLITSKVKKLHLKRWTYVVIVLMLIFLNQKIPNHLHWSFSNLGSRCRYNLSRIWKWYRTSHCSLQLKFRGCKSPCWVRFWSHSKGWTSSYSNRLHTRRRRRK